MAPANDLDVLLGRVRQLSERYKAGNRASFESFRELASLLLGLTIMRPGGGVRLFGARGRMDRLVLGGWTGPDDAVLLNPVIFTD